MKISILGTGAYGLALALMFDKNNTDIHMWSKFEDEIKQLDKKREHVKALPGVKIPKTIKFTTDLQNCVENADLI